KQKYRLREPVPGPYLRWISGVSHRDFGGASKTNVSVRTADQTRAHVTHEAVWKEITRRLDVTIPLNLAGIAIAVLLGIPLGVLSALRRGRALDRLLVPVSVFFMCTPAFALALFSLYFFGFKLGWFPLYGPGSWVFDRVHHLA